MKLMLKDIKPNEEITTYLAVDSIDLRRNKDHRLFVRLNLYDRTGRIKGYIWNDPAPKSSTLQESSYVKVNGLVKMINNSMLLDIDKIRPADSNEIQTDDFLLVVPDGVDYWQRKLFKSLEYITDIDCKRLVDKFLADESFFEKFIISPGGVSVHHDYIGGLLEHTVNTMALAASIADNNPELINKDLLLTGAFLHDIGKTKELEYGIVKKYTTEGKLLGHVLIGLTMIESKIAELDNFPKDIEMALKHMLISHHGEPNFGSPVRPATSEALALHMIDNTDAKLNHIKCYLRNSNMERQWSQFDKILNTEIYHPQFSKRFPIVEDLAA